jgi:hypothetical protein
MNLWTSTQVLWLNKYMSINISIHVTKLGEYNMNTANNANSHRISIDELVVSTATEIKENLSDAELNGVTGGISSTGAGPINPGPIEQFGCPTCRSGYDPRFDDMIPKPRK